MKLNITEDVKLGGKFRLRTRLADGTITKDTGWFDNLLTNQGLNWIGNYPAGIAQYVAVGTSSTTPAYTDTNLGTFLAAVGYYSISSYTYTVGPPDYVSVFFTYNYAIGAATGNLTEIGTGDNTANTLLFSHALILDSLGSPTTLTVLSYEQLEVTYELRLYMNLTDTSYSFVVSGVTHSGVWRRANANAVSDYSYAGGSGQGLFYVSNGSIGTVNSVPTGIGDSVNASLTTAYVNGNYYNSWNAYFPTTAGNMTGGVTAFLIYGMFGDYQASVSPAIAKTSAYSLTINFNASWARYP